ncbi:MAG: MFS transporter [Elainellaceae cyanobacterium]
MMPTLLTAVGIALSPPAAFTRVLAHVLAQVPGTVPGTVLETPEEASVVFSGPNFFITLIAGIVLAFAFQFLLTNLGVAAGISLVGGSSDHSSSSSSSSDDLGETISKIGFAVGVTTLITVVISLFCAIWLAVQLSLLVSPGLGAVMGLVIWAAYFSLLLWISSTTVGSLVGSVVNTATSGVQALFGTAASVFQTNVNDGMVATAEAAAAAVRKELTSVVDSDYLQEQVEDYLQSLRSPDLDMGGLRAEFESMIEESGIEGSGGEALPPLQRDDFIKLVDDRTDLSNRERDRIADQLYAVWSRRASRTQNQQSNSRLLDYIQQATADQLTGSEFDQKLDQLISAVRSDGSQRSSQSASNGGSNSGLMGTITQTLTPTLTSLASSIVMGRTDLSDIDVETITGKLKSAQSELGQQANKLPGQEEEPYNVIREDAKDYLLNTYHWRMSQERMAREFRDIIYDPNADPSTVSYQLDHISRSDFVDWLGQRGVFTQDEIQKRADTLESIRVEALSAAAAAMEREQVINLMEEVEAYLLKTPVDDLTPEKIQLNFKPVLQDSNASEAQLSARLSRLDRTFFDRVLLQRKDITETEVGFIVMQLEKARNEVLEEAADAQKAIQAKATNQWDKIKAFLRETDRQELDPDALERELSVLLDDPQAGLAALKTRASQFDRNTLVQVLNQRQDFSESEINSVIDQVERRWRQIRYVPKQLVGEAKVQYDQAMSTLTDYLRRTNRDELNPKGIRQDLQLLFDSPELGLKAFRARLSEVDRETLVALMAQRQDLSRADADRIITDVMESLRDIARAPRRIARRAQKQVQDFQTTVEEYLRSTDKAELHPEGIKRDVTLLLNQPQAGMSNLSDRLAQFDRTTVAALLAQRNDMTREEADQVVNQVMSVKDEMAHQMRLIQERVGAMVNRLLAQVRSYLNSLDRPELEYDGVKRDVRTLFDDPNAGFDALRARLGRFNRDTLVAIASSNDRISQADANRVIDQVERARNSVLQQAEYVQREAQLKLEQMKRQAAHRAEETRKAAAAASWWLFLTALLSAIASAGAGVLGVIS